MENKLVFQEVSKVYGEGNTQVTALDRVSLEVRAGEFVAVVGPRAPVRAPSCPSPVPFCLCRADGCISTDRSLPIYPGRR